MIPASAKYPLVIALAVAITVRLVIFIVVAVHPISADSGNLVSPSILNGTDLPSYLDAKREFFTGSVEQLVKKFAAYYVSPQKQQEGLIVTAPLFPALLLLFKYDAGNTWPLAGAFLVGGMWLVAMWLRWLVNRGVPLFWLIVFAIVPSPVYYAMCIGTDLPFSILFALFFLHYMKEVWTRQDIFIWGMALFLSLLTRPNALSILMFVLIDLLVLEGHETLKSPWFLLGATLVVGALGLFYYPYFMTEMHGASRKMFFGSSSQEYWGGMFSSVPGWLNILASWTALCLARILYFAGLRPSYSGVSTFFVVMRALPGLILLPGIVYLFWKGEPKEKLLVSAFLLPIVIASSQDRYNLPIQPLLFFYGVRALARAKAQDWVRPGVVKVE